MSLLKRIETDYVVAYKAKDADRLGVLRHLKTALKNFQVETRREATEADALDLVGKQAKQRADSIEQFEKAGREDLAAVERAELAILKDYLPEQLSAEAMAQAVDEAVAETGASGMKDMGKVMGLLTPRLKGRVDGKALAEAVKARLA